MPEPGGNLDKIEIARYGPIIGPTRHPRSCQSQIPDGGIICITMEASSHEAP